MVMIFMTVPGNFAYPFLEHLPDSRCRQGCNSGVKFSEGAQQRGERFSPERAASVTILAGSRCRKAVPAVRVDTGRECAPDHELKS